MQKVTGMQSDPGDRKGAHCRLPVAAKQYRLQWPFSIAYKPAEGGPAILLLL